MSDIIVNADDFGMSESINDAIAFSFSRGIINQTTLMVNMPFCEDAVNLARREGFINSVGLHLNLDKGIPLTDLIKKEPLFCNNHGEFNGAIWKKILSRTVYMPKPTQKALRTEIEAQIKKFLEYKDIKLHIDSHHHIHTNMTILRVLIPLCKEYRIESVRLAALFKGENLIKSAYKHYVNHYICQNISGTIPFYADKYFMKTTINEENREYMVHPDFNRGEYVNVLNRKNEVYGNLCEINLLK